MATLTGFKQVSESAGGQQQPGAGGQQNPVFVFDEIEVGDGAAAEQADRFEDAASHQEQPGAGEQASATTVEMGAAPEADTPPGAGTPPGQPPAQRRHKGARSATGAQLEKGAQQPQQQQQQQPAQQQRRRQQQQQQQPQPPQQHQDEPNSQQAARAPNSLAPHRDEGDNISLLAIDCAGTGKSPRQPRRSPLMALFRGKPRESVRRTYTDVDQFEIEWANLSLEVQKKWYQKVSLAGLLLGGEAPPGAAKQPQQQQPRMILRGVDGRIRSGEITAVLGPSGAGKTSLLNSLFGKYRSAVQGAIRVTGAPSKKHLTVCTIPQSDYLIGYLSTEESLWFASRLKNCEHDFNHERNIERVIELLGLQRCRHTRINKLSGGQYKRVSIAQEMLSSPDILVLDEPTSGLDSLTCYRTVKVLRDLVEASKAHNLVNPMSIILTIHQPHREVLDLFHSVYVMAVGGQTMFQGPPGEMESCIDKYSGTSMPAQGYNPASFMVELASEEYGREPIEALVRQQRAKFKASTKHEYNFSTHWLANETTERDLVNLYSKQGAAAAAAAGGMAASKQRHTSDSQAQLYANEKSVDGKNFVEIELEQKHAASNGKQQHLQQLLSTPNRDIDSRIMTPRSGKNSDGVFWRHVSLMSKRCFLSNTRDPLLCTIRVGAHIFIPLVVALIYGPRMGIPNGCPFYKPEINLLEYASMGVEEIQEKHDDIRIQFQNVGLHFMVYYAFGLCMLAFTAISFPLIMHVLIKEIRNGWYSLATFIIGKMFAELPMALILPPISVGIIYVMTGQPSSYLEWRYMCQSLILILIVMIAEAKGLIFGAVCMNSMQTAVFAASVSTVPFILLSGFLIRIREVPYVLQHLAQFSYFKHAVEALIITRYGFGMCPCDPALIPAGGTPRIIGIPPQIMSLTDYYVNSYVSATENVSNAIEPTEDTILRQRQSERIVAAVTTLRPEIVNLEPGDSSSSSAEVESVPVVASSGAVSSEVPTSEPPTSVAPTTSEASTASSVTSTPASATGQTSRRRRRRRRAAPAARHKATTAAPKTTTEEVTDIDISTQGSAPKQGLFFDKLATLLTRANAFGFSIITCEDVEPFTMKDMMLKDSMLAPVIGYLFMSIVVMKFVSYFIVEICVKLKL